MMASADPRSGLPIAGENVGGSRFLRYSLTDGYAVTGAAVGVYIGTLKDGFVVGVYIGTIKDGFIVGGDATGEDVAIVGIVVCTGADTGE